MSSHNYISLDDNEWAKNGKEEGEGSRHRFLTTMDHDDASEIREVAEPPGS